MTSRLDRLFLLLETGSTPLTRKAAALQLGEVQRLHPHELRNLLQKVRQYLRSSAWETRIAASQAIEAIVENVPLWLPVGVTITTTTKKEEDDGVDDVEDKKKVKVEEDDEKIKVKQEDEEHGGTQEQEMVDIGSGSGGDGGSTDGGGRMMFDYYDVHTVIKCGYNLLASEGKEFDDPDAAGLSSSMSTTGGSNGVDQKEKIAQQRKALNERLGLGLMERFGIQLDSIISNADLVGSSGSMSMNSSTTTTTTTTTSTRDLDSTNGGGVNDQSRITTTPTTITSLAPTNEAKLDEILTKATGKSLLKRTKSLPPNQLVGSNQPHQQQQQSGQSTAPLKRMKSNDSLIDMGTSKKVKLDQVGGGGGVDQDPTNGTTNTDSPESANEWPLEWFADELMADLFNPAWEIRHGAATGLREIVRLQGRCGGRHRLALATEMDQLNQQWLEDLSLRLLSVLALDRFGDYLSDQVVAPVRETCAQVLGSVIKLLSSNGVQAVLKILLQLLQCREWEARHGGMLGIRYMLAIRTDMIHLLLPQVFEPVFNGLKDQVDDVSAVAAGALVPVKNELMSLLPEKVPLVIAFLWESLLDLDDLSSSTGDLLMLLSSLLTFKGLQTSSSSSSKDLVNGDKDHQQDTDTDTDNHRQNNIFGYEDKQLATFIPRLWPFLSHTLSSVRKSVLDSLLILLDKSSNDWITPALLSNTLRLLYQRSLLETNDLILDQLYSVWLTILDKARYADLIDATCNYVSGWILLMMHPARVAIDPAHQPVWLEVKHLHCSLNNSNNNNIGDDDGGDGINNHHPPPYQQQQQQHPGMVQKFQSGNSVNTHNVQVVDQYYIGGADSLGDTVEERERCVIRARYQCAKLIGTLAYVLTTEPKILSSSLSSHQSSSSSTNTTTTTTPTITTTTTQPSPAEALESFVTILLYHLSTKSAIQRMCTAWIIKEWARHRWSREGELAPIWDRLPSSEGGSGSGAGGDGGATIEQISSSSPLHSPLAARCLDALQEPIYFDEIGSQFARIQMHTRDFVSTLRTLKVDFTEVVTTTPTTLNVMYTFPQILTLLQEISDVRLPELRVKYRSGLSKNRPSKKLKQTIDTLDERCTFLRRAVTDAQQYVSSLTMGVNSSLASALISWYYLPREKFNPIVRPLMESIKCEENEQLQRGCAWALVRLLRMCCERIYVDPTTVTPLPKIIKNLITYLCSDRNFTPDVSLTAGTVMVLAAAENVDKQKRTTTTANNDGEEEDEDEEDEDEEEEMDNKKKKRRKKSSLRLSTKRSTRKQQNQSKTKKDSTTIGIYLSTTRSSSKKNGSPSTSSTSLKTTSTSSSDATLMDVDDDVAVTAEAAEQPPPLRVQLGILALENMNRTVDKSMQLKRSTSVINNAAAAAAAATTINGSSSPNGSGPNASSTTSSSSTTTPPELLDKQQEILRRGATIVLAESCRYFGDTLPIRLPSLWEYISLLSNTTTTTTAITDEDNITKDNTTTTATTSLTIPFPQLTESSLPTARHLIQCLQVIEVIGPHLHHRLQQQCFIISNAYEVLCRLLESPYIAIRHMVARCFGMLATILPTQTMNVLLDKTLDMLDASDSELKRQGAVETICCVIERLQLKIVPYIVFLIVPMLGRMSDQNEPVRLMATHCFAELVQLMPLDNANNNSNSSSNKAKKNLEESVQQNGTISANIKNETNDDDSEATTTTTTPSSTANHHHQFSPELLRRKESERHFLEQLMNIKKITDHPMPIPIRAQLRTYQQEGLNWLAFLNKYKLHGIVADEMGLGKTLQAICIVASDYHTTLARYRRGRSRNRPLPSIVICPPTITGHWMYEVSKFVSKRYLCPIHYTGPPTERASIRKRIRDMLALAAAAAEVPLVDGDGDDSDDDKDTILKNHVDDRDNDDDDDDDEDDNIDSASCCNLVIASYELVRNDIEFFSTIKWNYCILDEGHTIKNGKTKIARAIKSLIANHRLILTGTPIQNNVLELWSLFDFLMPGFLGSERQFTARFSKPILSARDAKCSSKEQEAGIIAMESLHRQVLPFILRRMKEDVLQDLPPKIIQDYYCELSPLQAQLYEDFYRSRARETLKDAFNSVSKTVEDGDGDADSMMKNIPAQAKPYVYSTHTSHIFQSMTYLRKVCNHPKLVLYPAHPNYHKIMAQLKAESNVLNDIQNSAKLVALKQLLLDCGIGTTDNNNGQGSGSGSGTFPIISAAAASSTSDSSTTTTTATTSTRNGGGSGSLVVGSNAEPVVNQHRALVFCQLKSMLDIVEHDLLRVHMRSVSYLRLDGDVPLSQRYNIVHRFNNDPSIDLLLLTTPIGGLGLNLTGADTVIFVEHDWNPMKDLQAMDRAHRIGQKKVVNVYRLITSGTLEEKIMSLQKFKLTIANTIVSADNSSLDSMATDQLLDLFELSRTGYEKNLFLKDSAAAAAATGASSSGSGRGRHSGSESKTATNNEQSNKSGPAANVSMKVMLESLPELWDIQQYENEYNMNNFLQSLQDTR